jgi:integrase
MTVDRYIDAATRANTRRSYRSAIEHYEAEWGGFLPATADSVARYLAAYASILSISTLKLRLAALAQWHLDQGFPDPTKAPLVKKVLKGIRELHPEREKQAAPLQLHQLEQLVSWLLAEETCAEGAGDQGLVARCRRDRALVLLGFWRAFRSDELCRLRIEHGVLHAGQGLELYLPRNKGDRRNEGTVYKVPALSRLCPVEAYQSWIEISARQQGPVFCGIDRWGLLGEEALHPNSIIPLLRTLMQRAGITDAVAYSSHSLRRGFATWANGQGWDVKALMEYVGWRDMKSALRYIEGSDPFAQQQMEAGLAATAPQLMPPGPTTISPMETTLELQLQLDPLSKAVRSLKRACQSIETCCLKPYRMQPLGRNTGRYQLTVTHASPEMLEEGIDALLDEMHQIANNHQCHLEAMLTDPLTDRTWS